MKHEQQSIYLDPADWREIKRLAKLSERSAAGLVRTLAKRYIREQRQGYSQRATDLRLIKPRSTR